MTMDTSVPGPEVWGSSAACRGMDADLFYPEGRGAVIPLAVIEVCEGCPVIEQCRTYALHHEAKGHWGATSAYQRLRVRQATGIRLKTPESVEPAPHGTDAAYQRHQRVGDLPCPACTEAHTRRHTGYRRAQMAS